MNSFLGLHHAEFIQKRPHRFGRVYLVREIFSRHINAYGA